MKKSIAVPIYAMKACRGAEVHLHLFFISALDGGKYSISRTGPFCFGKEPQFPSDRSLSRLQNLSEYFEEEKNLLPIPGFECWTVQPKA